MTAISAFDCRNGVVLASDGMMSIGNIISRPTLKLSIHDDQTNNPTILGLAGDQGFDLRFKSIVAKYPNFNSMHSYLKKANIDLSSDPWAQSKPWLHYPMLLSHLLIDNLKFTGAYHAQNRTEFGALLGYVYENKSYCCRFNQYLQPMLLDSNNYYDAIGSGATQTLPFLRQLDDARHGIIDRSIHVKRILTPPELGEGCLIAYWSIHRAIRTSPAWVGLGIDMLTLYENESGTIEVTKVSNAQMYLYNEHIAEKEQNLMA